MQKIYIDIKERAVNKKIKKAMATAKCTNINMVQTLGLGPNKPLTMVVFCSFFWTFIGFGHAREIYNIY